MAMLGFVSQWSEFIITLKCLGEMFYMNVKYSYVSDLLSLVFSSQFSKTA